MLIKVDDPLPILHWAVEEAQREFGDNLKLRAAQLSPSLARFTLRCVSSRGPGHRIGRKGQRLACACWHVHYAVLDAIFRLAPEARIKTALATYAGREEFLRMAEAAGAGEYQSLCSCQKERAT